MQTREAKIVTEIASLAFACGVWCLEYQKRALNSASDKILPKAEGLNIQGRDN